MCSRNFPCSFNTTKSKAIFFCSFTSCLPSFTAELKAIDEMFAPKVKLAEVGSMIFKEKATTEAGDKFSEQKKLFSDIILTTLPVNVIQRIRKPKAMK